MPDVTANGIKIEYDTFGDPGARPLVLIMGLASQMIFWDEGFCRMLADKGHYVVRFDNRDIGLSEKIDHAGVPNPIEGMQKAMKGEKVDAPYTIDDMADDTVGLMDALGLDKAHICGASMGGMIAQTLAYRYPERVLTMISIMSSTGDPSLPQAKPEAMSVLLTPPPSERDAYIEHTVKTWKVIGSPGFEFNEDRVRDMATSAYDRCFHPAGVVRQLMAIVAHGSRKEALGKVTAPTLIIHGADDPLVPVEAGKHTAESVPGAKLVIFKGMGHDVPVELWPEISDAIAEHTLKA